MCVCVCVCVWSHRAAGLNDRSDSGVNILTAIALTNAQLHHPQAQHHHRQQQRQLSALIELELELELEFSLGTSSLDGSFVIAGVRDVVGDVVNV